MSERFPELAPLAMDVPHTTRRSHLRVIDDALGADPIGRSTPTGTNPNVRRLLALVAAVMLVFPGTALASVDAVPGDGLYGFKRLIEPMLAVFDSDLSARWRVSELETLIERDAPENVIALAAQEARMAVAASGSGPLGDRLDRATESQTPTTSTSTTPAAPPPAGEDNAASPSSDDDRIGDSSARPERTTTSASNTTLSTQRDRDGRTSTSTRTPDGDRPTTTSTVRDGDRTTTTSTLTRNGDSDIPATTVRQDPATTVLRDPTTTRSRDEHTEDGRPRDGDRR